MNKIHKKTRYLLIALVGCAIGVSACTTTKHKRQADDDNQMLVGAPPSQDDPFFTTALPPPEAKAPTSGSIEAPTKSEFEETKRAKAEESKNSVAEVEKEEPKERVKEEIKAEPVGDSKQIATATPAKPEAAIEAVQNQAQCFSCVRICQLDDVQCEEHNNDVICGWGTSVDRSDAQVRAQAECDAALDMARQMQRFSYIEGSCPIATCQ